MEIAFAIIGAAVLLGALGTLVWMWIDFGEPPWKIFGKSGTHSAD